MSRGKHLSLEEARQTGRIDRFAKEHPSKETQPGRFDALLDAMTRSSPEAGRTSGPEPSACYTDTRTRRGTSKDA